MPPVEVLVRNYGDRGDPLPPNTHRVEISVGEHTFLYDTRIGHDGCMPRQEADHIAEEVKEALGLS